MTACDPATVSAYVVAMFAIVVLIGYPVAFLLGKEQGKGERK